MSLTLELLVPDGVVLDTPVSSVQAADASGRFGLLPGHQKFVTLLSPCLLVFRQPDGRERYAAADGGVLLLEGERATVATHEAVVADQPEQAAEAAAAMLAARRTEERSARGEFAELQLTLLRELRQLEDGHVRR